jgi:hypothetical protein
MIKKSLLKEENSKGKIKRKQKTRRGECWNVSAK